MIGSLFNQSQERTLETSCTVVGFVLGDGSAHSIATSQKALGKRLPSAWILGHHSWMKWWNGDERDECLIVDDLSKSSSC